MPSHWAKMCGPTGRYTGFMTLPQVILLAIIQGLAELLPVSSSAHVVVAEKLMGLDPSAPQMTLLLVMLHTGTMFAVIVYFWKTWKQAYFSSREAFKPFAMNLVWATLLTGIVGEVLKKIIELTLFRGAPKAEIEDLFSHLELIAPALAAAGLLVGAEKQTAERFSFAMAVVLTPPVVAMEAMRLVKSAHASATPIDLHASLALSLVGAACSFLAGLLALKWLSSWLESGRWHWFGVYCVVASIAVFYLHMHGF